MRARSFQGKLGELSPEERQALLCLLSPCLTVSWLMKQVFCLPLGSDSQLSNTGHYLAALQKRTREHNVWGNAPCRPSVLWWLGRWVVRGDQHAANANNATTAPISGENGEAASPPWVKVGQRISILWEILEIFVIRANQVDQTSTAMKSQRKMFPVSTDISFSLR